MSSLGGGRMVGNVRPEKIPIFLKKGKIVISAENPEFF